MICVSFTVQFIFVQRNIYDHNDPPKVSTNTTVRRRLDLLYTTETPIHSFKQGNFISLTVPTLNQLKCDAVVGTVRRNKHHYKGKRWLFSMVHSMPIQIVSWQSYKVKIRTFGPSKKPRFQKGVVDKPLWFLERHACFQHWWII